MKRGTGRRYWPGACLRVRFDGVEEWGVVWLMMQPIRRPLAPKSLKNPLSGFVSTEYQFGAIADLAHSPQHVDQTRVYHSGRID